MVNIRQLIKIAEAEEKKLIKEGLVGEFELGTLWEISQIDGFVDQPGPLCPSNMSFDQTMKPQD